MGVIPRPRRLPLHALSRGTGGQHMPTARRRACSLGQDESLELAEGLVEQRLLLFLVEMRVPDRR